MAQTQRKIDIPEKFQYQYRADYQSDWDIHRNYIQNFDPWEAMLMGQVYDTVSNSVDGGRITDSYATTLAKERADRVMAKLPDGETQAVGKADVGKAAYMDILRQKWIYPNANAQHSFQEKLNMWQFYSSVYGYMPMFYDWNVSPSGYSGPDCWLWNPRNLVPQQGRTSLNDMEYVTALSWVSKSYLENIIDGKPDGNPENDEDDSGWDYDALELLVDVANHGSYLDYDQDTKVSRDRTPRAEKKGICLATRYEAGEDGEWITFAPDHGNVQVRRLKNPHENGRIPFVIKYSQPLFDSFYGLGDFQRAMPLQFARDGLTNFYFKGIKMNLIPPIIANANGVLKHTLDYREGAVMLETIPNSIRRLETSTAGLATFQAAQSQLTGSLLSLYGSQNGAISGQDASNPSQGRTPQAIDLYADKEATRDGSERRHLEDAIQQLTNGFFSLVANIGTSKIPVALFAEDVEDMVKSGLKDVEGLFDNFEENESNTAGVMTINPAAFKNIELRFYINPDSTAQASQMTQLQSVKDMITSIGTLQNVIQQDPRFTVHWEKIMASYEQLSAIPGASEFITFDPEAKPLPQAQSATAQQTPGSNVMESADLVKLYLGTTDQSLQNQIVIALGFKPGPPTPPAVTPPEPTVISSGHMFNDPHVAAAAEGINSHPAISAPAPMPQPEQPAEPTVISSGHAFNDATIGAAAEAINNHSNGPIKNSGR